MAVGKVKRHAADATPVQVHTSEVLQQAQACTERFMSAHMRSTRLIAHGDILGNQQDDGTEPGPGLISADFFETR